jgi:hypothetical protein
MDILSFEKMLMRSDYGYDGKEEHDMVLAVPIINGRPLAEILEKIAPEIMFEKGNRNFIYRFADELAKNHEVNILMLGNEEIIDLMICANCHDSFCCSVSASITLIETKVIWNNFFDEYDLTEDEKQFTNISFEFELEQYKKALKQLQIIENEAPKPNADYDVYYKAKKYNCNHKPELKKDSICGCYFCFKIFDPKEIKTWITDENGTAECPYCYVDVILGEYTGFPITTKFLQYMYRRAFCEKFGSEIIYKYDEQGYFLSYREKRND